MPSPMNRASDMNTGSLLNASNLVRQSSMAGDYPIHEETGFSVSFIDSNICLEP